MNTAVLTIKTPVDVKTQAQATARDLGFSLSSLVNAYLRQLIKTKTVHFSLEEPTPYLVDALRESKSEVARGNVSPSFTAADDAINWLREEQATYAGPVQQKVQKNSQSVAQVSVTTGT